MAKRPRIGIPTASPAITDTLEFTKNKCSESARKVISHFENIEVELWFDKHYYVRAQHGDDYGKREGIDIEVVKDLVRSSIKHLYYYSLRIDGFAFINFSDQAKRFFRVLLKENYSGDKTLNVVVEFHFVDFRKYEVTIKTAMREDDFKVSDGQYIIELIDKDTSNLSRKNVNGIQKIFNM